MTKHYKTHIFIVISSIFFIISFVAYSLFTRTPQFLSFYSWAQNNLLFFFLLLFLLKILGGVYPPLPGGLITIGAIPIIGWFPAYIIDFLGSTAGGTISYYLGHKYGLVFLRKFLDHGTVENIQKIKIKKDRELESMFVLRLLLGSTIIEAINYGAGLLRVKYSNFLMGSIASHIVYGIPTFLIGESLLKGQNTVVSLVTILIALLIFMKIKGRYFE